MPLFRDLHHKPAIGSCIPEQDYRHVPQARVFPSRAAGKYIADAKPL